MKSKVSLKRVAVALVIALGIGVAGERLYRAYQKFYPVASVGECLSVPVNSKNYKVLIMRNDNDAHAHDLLIQIELFPGYTTVVSGKVTYKELRELGAKKVPCNEEVN